MLALLRPGSARGSRSSSMSWTSRAVFANSFWWRIRSGRFALSRKIKAAEIPRPVQVEEMVEEHLQLLVNLVKRRPSLPEMLTVRAGLNFQCAQSATCATRGNQKNNLLPQAPEVLGRTFKDDCCAELFGEQQTELCGGRFADWLERPR